MIEQIVSKLFLIFVCLPPCLLIGGISLLYNIHRFDYSFQTIRLFLMSLPFPMNILYGNSEEAVASYINQATDEGVILRRLIFSTVPIIVIVALISDMKSNGSIFLINLASIIIIFLMLFYFWRFADNLNDRFKD